MCWFVGHIEGRASTSIVLGPYLEVVFESCLTCDVVRRLATGRSRELVAADAGDVEEIFSEEVDPVG